MVIYVAFLHNVALQKLLKSANVSWSYSQNNTGTVFLRRGVHCEWCVWVQGVLLYGPPGTGKTLLARAVAHHTECTFIRVSGSELVQKFIGEGSRMVRELFVMARFVKFFLPYCLHCSHNTNVSWCHIHYWNCIYWHISQSAYKSAPKNESYLVLNDDPSRRLFSRTSRPSTCKFLWLLFDLFHD